MLYQLQLVHIFMATYTIIRIQADTFFVSDNKGRDSGKKKPQCQIQNLWKCELQRNPIAFTYMCHK